MKTGKFLGLAAVLSTMIAANAQARGGEGGGMAFHGGGGMAFHGGGGGFVRSAPAFRGGFAQPAAFRSGGFVRPMGTFARPAAFRQPLAPVNQRFVNQRFINQRFVNQRFVNERFDHRHFDHRHNRNIVVIAGVPYYYPYYSSYYYPSNYYPTDYYSNDYPSDYSNYYAAPSSTYATTYVAPTSYTYAVAGTSSVIALQQRLAREGYYHGAIDGAMGPKTRSAMERFERDHGRRPVSAIHRSHSHPHKSGMHMHKKG